MVYDLGIVVNFETWGLGSGVEASRSSTGIGAGVTAKP